MFLQTVRAVPLPHPNNDPYFDPYSPAKVDLVRKPNPVPVLLVGVFLEHLSGNPDSAGSRGA